MCEWALSLAVGIRRQSYSINYEFIQKHEENLWTHASTCHLLPITSVIPPLNIFRKLLLNIKLDHDEFGDWHLIPTTRVTLRKWRIVNLFVVQNNQCRPPTLAIDHTILETNNTTSAFAQKHLKLIISCKCFQTIYSFKYIHFLLICFISTFTVSVVPLRPYQHTSTLVLCIHIFLILQRPSIAFKFYSMIDSCQLGWSLKIGVHLIVGK